MSHSAMLRRMAGMMPAWPWVALALTITAASIVGIAYDIRYLILALMIIFIVAPMVMALLYFHYGFRRECFMNTMPHTLKPLREGVRIRLFRTPDNDDVLHDESGEAEALENGGNDDMAGNPAYECCGEFIIEYSILGSYFAGMQSVTFPVGRPHSTGFLWIPESAYSVGADFRIAVDRIAGEISSSRKRGCDQ